MAQNVLGNFLRHTFEDLIARLQIHVVFLHAHGVCHQNLDVDFMVGGIHAAGIVEEVRVQTHTFFGKLNTAKLRDAQIGALTDNACA